MKRERVLPQPLFSIGARILSIYENKWMMPFRKRYTQKIGCASYN